MERKMVIFDFDGTIADSIMFGFRLAQELAPSYGYREIEDDEFQKFRGMGILQIAREFDIPYYKFPAMMIKIRKELAIRFHEVEPISDIRESLLKMKDMGIKLGIATSNTRENVDLFLQMHKLEIFNFVTSELNLFAKHNLLLKLKEEHSIDPERFVYVGDETRDIKAAKKAGAKIISVTWGGASKEFLQSKNPDFIVDTPDELYETVKQIYT